MTLVAVLVAGVVWAATAGGLCWLVMDQVGRLTERVTRSLSQVILGPQTVPQPLSPAEPRAMPSMFPAWEEEAWSTDQDPLDAPPQP